MPDLHARVPQSEEYARYADAHWRELMDRYQPSILWNDIDYPRRGDLTRLFADFYNRTPEGVVNNRWGVEFSDFTTPEYAMSDRVAGKKWEATRGLGFSFGYNQVEGPEQVLSAARLIATFVDIVSKGGNLLLNIGPRADGSIPPIQLERLRSLGAWLKTNGDAIFATRPWVRPEGRTADGIDVRFTRRGDAVYAILLGRPKGARVTLENLTAAPGAAVEVLGAGASVWKQNGRNLEVAWPHLPESEAYALKIVPVKE